MKIHIPMSRKLLSSTAVASALLLSCLSSHATDVATVPQGYVTLNIAAGTGSTRTVTVLSFPLVEQSTASGQMTGLITAVTSTGFTNSNGGWTAGQLSSASTPYIIRITSGAAQGRSFLISTSTANTATQVTLDSGDLTQTTPTSLGIIAGTDTYEIVACDTLASIFGTPATTQVLGGTSVAAADNVLLLVNGSWQTYYFDTNTGKNRWTRSTFGSPDATNTVLRPDSGIMFSRLANTSLSFTLLGRVPTTDRKTPVANSGVTFLTAGWPVDTTLASSKIQDIPGWTSASAVANADTVTLYILGSWRTYWYDGTNWRRSTFGSPISDTQVITAGTSLMLTQLGTATGTSLYSQTRPYTY